MTDDIGRSSEPSTDRDQRTALEPSRMSFGDHLDELRRCLMLALGGVAITTVAALAMGNHILEFIFQPLWFVQQANGLQPRVQALSPIDGFASYLKIGLMTGLIVAMPWVLYQVWRFVASGLYEKERRFATRLTIASTGLFAVGVLFLYYIVLPIVLQFFITFNSRLDSSSVRATAFQRLLTSESPKPQPVAPDLDTLHVPVFDEDPADPDAGELWVNAQTRRLVLQTRTGPWSIPFEPGATVHAVESQFAISAYISFVLMLALAFGIAFETPVVVFFLAWTGLVTTAKMASSRRHVLGGMVIMAAVMTPPDVVSQLLLAGPMYALFEIGICVAKVVERRRVQ